MTASDPRPGERPSPEGPRLPPPIEQAAEVLIYAPLGFVLGLPRDFPTYVDRGRREVAEVQAWLGRRAHDAVHESSAALRGLGLLPAAHPTGPEPSEQPEPQGPPTLSVVPTPEADPSPDPVQRGAAGPDADSLAIPGYESLSASQVVPRLVSLSADELEAVRRYESAARGRKTILSRIAQLQAG